MLSVTSDDVCYRPGTSCDALCVSVLAVQVFLDTYATDGIRPDLAREALSTYSPEAFAERLADPARAFVLAERSGHLVAFAEVAFDSISPVQTAHDGAELVRLYVQSRFKRVGIGSALLAQAEKLACLRSAKCLWLTAWVGNAPALAFYAALHYTDLGATSYVLQGEAHENRIFAKPLAAVS